MDVVADVDEKIVQDSNFRKGVLEVDFEDVAKNFRKTNCIMRGNILYNYNIFIV